MGGRRRDPLFAARDIRRVRPGGRLGRDRLCRGHFLYLAVHKAIAEVRRYAKALSPEGIVAITMMNDGKEPRDPARVASRVSMDRRHSLAAKGAVALLPDQREPRAARLSRRRAPDYDTSSEATPHCREDLPLAEPVLAVPARGVDAGKQSIREGSRRGLCPPFFSWEQCSSGQRPSAKRAYLAPSPARPCLASLHVPRAGLFSGLPWGARRELLLPRDVA